MKLLHRLRFWILGFAGLAVILSAALVLVLRSDWFHEQVRQRILSEIENATGGKAEIGSYSFDWRNLDARIQRFVLHGTEPANQEPLFTAAEIAVRLHIVSMLERRVDLAALEVNRPRVHLLIAPDGSSNIPGPKTARQSHNLVDQILSLKIGHFALRDGSVLVNSDAWPLDVSGDGLSSQIAYEHVGDQYRGDFASSRVQISRPLASPLSFAAQTSFLFQRTKVVFSKLHLALPKSSVDLTAELRDYAKPHGVFSGSAQILPAEFVKPFRLPVLGTGEVQWNGKGTFFASPRALEVTGKILGKGLGYTHPRVDVRNASFAGDLNLSLERLRLEKLEAACSAGKFHGNLDLKNWRELEIGGNVSGVSLQNLAASLHQPDFYWSAGLSGPVKLSARLDKDRISGLVATAKIDVIPQGPGIPASGLIDLQYDEKSGQLQFGESHLAAGTTSAAFSGVLGKSVDVRAQTQDLRDIFPILRFAGVAPPDPFPVVLKGSTAHLEAVASGPIEDPDVRGHLSVGAFTFEGHSADRLDSDVEINQSLLKLDNLQLARNRLTVKGGGRAVLHGWKLEDSSTVTGAFDIQNADIKELAAEFGSKLPVEGMANGSVRVSNNFGAPHLEGSARVQSAKAWNQAVDRARGDFQIDGSNITVSNASIESGKITATGLVSYHRTGVDWGTGDVRFDLASNVPDITRIEALKSRTPGFSGAVVLNASGRGHIAKDAFVLNSLNGKTSITNAAYQGRPLGSATATASTVASQLRFQAQGKILDSDFQGEGQWHLDGDHNGSAKIDFKPVLLRNVVTFLTAEQAEQINRFNIAGSVGGTMTVTGSLNSLDTLRAQLRLPEVQLSGSPQLQARAGAKPQDFTITSTAPVVVDVTTKAITIQAARFNARDTQLSLGGTISLNSAVPSSLRVDGSMNLAILQLLNRDLLASGRATVAATLQGTFEKPIVNGRMELSHASLFLPDLPNGLDNANGVITFDRSRATIQSLSAETGGGKISFTGFVGFGSVLVYRLEATADQVRYRTPEGISATFNALLNLTGTSANSLVSGSVSVVRANLPPLTDLGSLMAESARPSVSLEQPNEYLRGMHFDIAVESAQSLEIRTALARDLQASIDLRLRGTPALPVLLGAVNVNQGQIELFGTRYTIDRGEAIFSNPLKIEPNIDLNLETRVRGIVVNLTLSGTPQKLNLSYRSDPPLESGQIVALLAVGRDPTSQGLVNPNSTQGNAFSGGAGGLLAGALTAPLTNRLDRLFGGSRIKIDPQATDLSTIPQARLVFEQPISKDITLTYITNLNRTDEQIVRVEWDFNTNWSAVASREENGLFGLVFQYRKRFK